MRAFHTFPLSASLPDVSRLLHWAAGKYSSVCYLTSSNNKKDVHSEFDAVLAVGIQDQICPQPPENAFLKLKDFTHQWQDWIFGFFSYDLKNQLEDLHSGNADGIKMPLMHFFVPEVIFLFKNNMLQVGFTGETTTDIANQLLQEIKGYTLAEIPARPVSIRHRVDKEKYVRQVNRIKSHIQKGDIYEANYCIEFWGENVTIDPVETFLSLNRRNPSPFACFYKLDDKYLMSSSPERFLAKRSDTLISQPIKGTIKRGKTPEEDRLLKEQLFNDPKERSENVMIVDLVRNDLSRTAQKGSVKVSELFGIYSYPHVHQMISTVESKLRKDVHFVDAIKNAFPMGSMTGAPKIRAMEIIEECEATRRGLYSGAVGYITPCRNFDFNVIIRSILYNQTDKFINFMAGSAITIASDPEKEYHECLLKADSMAQTLNAAF